MTLDEASKVLGVSSGDSKKEIKSKYRKLAYTTHPDRSGGDEEQFKKITEAYEILSGKRQPPRHSSNQHHPGGFPFDPSSVHDIINELNKQHADSRFQRRHTQRRAQSDDREIPVMFSLSLDDVKQGRSYPFAVIKSKDCIPCKGVGGEKKVECDMCKGVGHIQSYLKHENMKIGYQHSCPTCGGAGSRIENPCTECGGCGFTTYEEKMEIEIKIKS